MTNEEAINNLNAIGNILGDWFPGETSEPFKESLCMGMEALERQIPQKPFKLSPLFEDYFCPYCDSLHYDKRVNGKLSALCQVNKGDRFCSVCGQALDWSEVEE